MKFSQFFKLIALSAVFVITGCSDEDPFISQIEGSYTARDGCQNNSMEDFGEEYTLSISKVGASDTDIEIINFHNLGIDLKVTIEDEQFDWNDFPISIDNEDFLINGGGEFLVLNNTRILKFVYEIETDTVVTEICVTTGMRN